MTRSERKVCERFRVEWGGWRMQSGRWQTENGRWKNRDPDLLGYDDEIYGSDASDFWCRAFQRRTQDIARPTAPASVSPGHHRLGRPPTPFWSSRLPPLRC